MNKRVFLIIALIGIFFISFISGFNLFNTSAVSPVVVQSVGCGNCGTITYSNPVTSGHLLLFAFNQIGGSSCDATGLLTDSLGNSFFHLYTILNPGFANDAVCVYYVTSAFSGADTITLQSTETIAVAFELSGFTVNGSVYTSGGTLNAGTQAPQTWNYGATHSITQGVLSFELGATATQNSSGYTIGTITPTSGFTILAQVNGIGSGGSGLTDLGVGAYSYTAGGNVQDFPVSYVQPKTSTATEYDIVGFSFAGSSPYQPYQTQTTTYHVSWTNGVCAFSNGTSCSQQIKTTTIHYDNSSTVVLFTYCDSETGCLNYTNSATITQTYTVSSVLVVTSTTTTTTTQTAILAPTTSSLLYWFYGFTLLIIPPAAFTGIVKRVQPDADIEFPIMTGLFIGAMLSLLVQLLVAGIGFAVLALVIVYFWRRGR